MSNAKKIADVLSEMDGLDRTDRYVEFMRIAKVLEEIGEATQALIAYHNVNPRKEGGTVEEVIKELCDVALTAKVAIEGFGFHADKELADREEAVVQRLLAAQQKRWAAEPRPEPEPEPLILAGFWRSVPCGHPPDPTSARTAQGLDVCHCGVILDAADGLPVEGAPGPVVPCPRCGCAVAVLGSEGPTLAEDPPEPREIGRGV